MPRFHLPPESWSSGLLSGDEARHLTQVLRVRAGDTVTVFDGCGKSATATVLSTAKDHVALELGETTHTAPIRPAITLAQAIPKQKNMDLIVQKAVELGVTTIQPLVTRHTIVHPGDGKADKWRRIALEACKQCGQNTLPTIADPLPFDHWLAVAGASGSCPTRGAGILPAAPLSPPTHHLPIIASLAPGTKPLRDLLKAHPTPAEITLLIGPEGDFSPEETQAALAAGFLPASLGSIVLRVETASLFCLSAIRYEYPA
jgi:16S rRNA (uracil1498-N3)-methyltransferase